MYDCIDVIAWVKANIDRNITAVVSLRSHRRASAPVSSRFSSMGYVFDAAYAEWWEKIVVVLDREENLQDPESGLFKKRDVRMLHSW
jgi:hypothetical protein